LSMTTELKNILKRVEKWPKGRQADAVRMLETMDGQSDERYYLTPEQLKEVKKTQQAIRSGKMKFLTEKEVTNMWKSLGL